MDRVTVLYVLSLILLIILWTAALHLYQPTVIERILREVDRIETQNLKRVYVLMDGWNKTEDKKRYSGYLVIADNDYLRSKGYELVRDDDLGVLFIFNDVKAVCFINPFNYSINIYVVRPTESRLMPTYLMGFKISILRPNTTWCTLVFKDEMILESTKINELYITAVRG
jgi:hypothetical protein